MIGNAVWFEISASDLDCAVKFYEAVFQVALRREKIGGLRLKKGGGQGRSLISQYQPFSRSKYLVRHEAVNVLASDRLL